MEDKVLFVDDEAAIRNSMRRLFRGSGFRVLESGDGGEALKILQEEEVSVLVSDNRMPGMRGVELLSRVRQVSPDTVSILFTGYPDLSMAVDAINRGEVFRFLLKPWEDEEILRAVKEAAIRRNTRQLPRRSPGLKTEASTVLAQSRENPFSQFRARTHLTPDDLQLLRLRTGIKAYSEQQRIGQRIQHAGRRPKHCG
jgi:DNA-binding NtrC family response regulator